MKLLHLPVAAFKSSRIVCCLFVVGVLIALGIPPAFSQCELDKLVHPAGRVGDLFGSGVAVFGDYAIVGAPNDYYPTTTGSAHVFTREGSEWVYLHTLEKPSQAQGFGNAADMDGNTAVVADDTNGRRGWLDSWRCTDSMVSPGISKRKFKGMTLEAMIVSGDRYLSTVINSWWGPTFPSMNSAGRMSSPAPARPGPKKPR